MRALFAWVCLAPLAPLATQEPAETVRLEQLDLSLGLQDWGFPQRARTVLGRTMRLGGRDRILGVGVHAVSELFVDLGPRAARFEATVGVDEEAGKSGSVVFEVWGDGKQLWDSGPMRAGAAPKEVSVGLTGMSRLTLFVGNAGDGNENDHADWADARIALAPGAGRAPRAIAFEGSGRLDLAEARSLGEAHDRPDSGRPDRAREPAMLWSAALALGREPNADEARACALALAESGLAAAGYSATPPEEPAEAAADPNDRYSAIVGIGLAPSASPASFGPLMIGILAHEGKPRRTRLQPVEQVTQMSLWCLRGAPLVLACDPRALDPFTKKVLANPEVIAVDQDPRGEAARRLARAGSREVWGRRLADGSLVVGLFNRHPEAAEVSARFSDLGLAGRHRVRDLWSRSELEPSEGSIRAEVPGHGARLFRLTPLSGTLAPPR